MSSRPEDANPPDQPQPIDNDADTASQPARANPGDQSSGEATGGGLEESERPLIIP